MKMTVYFASLMAILPLFGASSEAQEPTGVHVVALDVGSSDLLKTCRPEISFVSLVDSEDEPYPRLNERALAMRDARYVVYRADRLSMTSQLFRDRLVAEGVQAIDLTRYDCTPRCDHAILNFANSGSPRVNEKQPLTILWLSLFLAQR